MKVLASVSFVQLIVQLVSALKAIRDRIPYDIPFGQGRPDKVARDMWGMGSGLAAPWHTLAVHAAGVVLLLARPRRWVREGVGWLGALYVLGILWERITMESFRHPNKDTTPLIAAGLALSLAMAVLGLGGRKRGSTGTE